MYTTYLLIKWWVFTHRLKNASIVSKWRIVCEWFLSWNVQNWPALIWIGFIKIALKHGEVLSASNILTTMCIVGLSYGIECMHIIAMESTASSLSVHGSSHDGSIMSFNLFSFRRVLAYTKQSTHMLILVSIKHNMYMFVYIHMSILVTQPGYVYMCDVNTRNHQAQYVYICVVWMKNEPHPLTHPTILSPFSTNEESVGRLPLRSSSKTTPKPYTSPFSVALPCCKYSVNKFGGHC